MTPDQSINEFARITRKLKDARKEVLEKEGLTEDGLQTLHDQAFCLMTSDILETEYGILQKIVDVPVQWSAHRMKDGILTERKLNKKRLKLLTNDKTTTKKGVTQ